MKISEKLLAWYATNARELPWRSDPQPYKVWISEIMLQQTQVDTVIPYFKKWILIFPKVKTLADASEQDILAVWEGLGYYSRARNIKKCADILLAQYNANIPSDPVLLQKLPGIGHYTAGAIASIAFNLDAIALDGNIKRVYARVMNLAVPVDSREGKKALEEFAVNQQPSGKAGDYNQALMDLGASICLPARPKCLLCPVQQFCLAFERGVQEQRPVIPEKKPIPHYVVTAAILQRDQQFLLAQRPANGLLGGLWEFPGGKQEAGETLTGTLEREIMEELGSTISVEKHFGEYQHAYTHFRVTLHAFLCSLIEGEPQPIEASQLAWVSLKQLPEYPMGKIDRMIADQLKKNDSKSL